VTNPAPFPQMETGTGALSTEAPWIMTQSYPNDSVPCEPYPQQFDPLIIVEIVHFRNIVFKL